MKITYNGNQNWSNWHKSRNEEIRMRDFLCVLLKFGIKHNTGLKGTEHMTVKINNWATLSDPVKTILERVDINRRGFTLQEGHEFDIPYFKGNITKQMLDEIKEYEQSAENEGFYKTISNGDSLRIVFLKGAFD